jgi:hypothetical protein
MQQTLTKPKTSNDYRREKQALEQRLRGLLEELASATDAEQRTAMQRLQGEIAKVRQELATVDALIPVAWRKDQDRAWAERGRLEGQQRHQARECFTDAEDIAERIDRLIDQLGDALGECRDLLTQGTALAPAGNFDPPHRFQQWVSLRLRVICPHLGTVQGEDRNRRVVEVVKAAAQRVPRERPVTTDAA